MLNTVVVVDDASSVDCESSEGGGGGSAIYEGLIRLDSKDLGDYKA